MSDSIDPDDFDLPLHDREGNPISFLEAGRLLTDENYRVLRKTWWADVEVSTVWLPLSLDGWRFETMIFGGPLDERCWRYKDEFSALEGHEAAVQAVKAAVAREQERR
ncbi:hypothetical protein [Candidatus Solirubrobacter pratensis]|uniref:hypothetical protein n=1 Tax=Candidatus Solirubrobacter pratensis TaxID=1298857 RepID=UPI00041A5884|nr:hypothetical protein [Candidatus Solirubrobacter pratensis]